MKKTYIRPAIQNVGICPISALLLPVSNGGTTDESLVSRQIDEEIWNSEDYWDSPFER